MAVPGAESKDIIGQARNLVNTMNSHKEVINKINAHF